MRENKPARKPKGAWFDREMPVPCSEINPELLRAAELAQQALANIELPHDLVNQIESVARQLELASVVDGIDLSAFSAMCACPLG